MMQILKLLGINVKHKDFGKNITEPSNLSKDPPRKSNKEIPKED